MKNTFLELKTHQQRIDFFGVHGEKKLDAMVSKLIKEFQPDFDLSKKYNLGYKVLEYTEENEQKPLLYVEWIVRTTSSYSYELAIEYMAVSYTGKFPELIAEKMDSFIVRHTVTG